MRRAPLVACCAALLSALLAACQSVPDDADVAAGRGLYQQYCALCHGATGEGYTADAANALTHPYFLAVADDAFLTQSILHGRSGTPMSPWGSAWGGPLDEAQAQQITRYLRSFQGDAPFDRAAVQVGPGKASRGQATYAATCQGCHGPAGGGHPYMSINHPQFLSRVDDAFLRASIALGRPGTPMPGYADKLTAQQIDDLVALLRSWQTDPSAAPATLPSLDLGEVLRHPQGPQPNFAAQPGRYVAAKDLNAALTAGARVAILDARPPADYPAFHLPGAVSTPFYAVAKYLDQLPKDAWIVTYCACPHAESGQAADTLQANGFTTVKVLDEGILYWRDQGYALESGVQP